MSGSFESRDMNEQAQGPGVAPLPAAPSDARRADRSRKVGSTGSVHDRFQGILRRVFDLADEDGVSRVEVADKLRVSTRALEGYLGPSGPTWIGGHRVFELLARGDVLPVRARLEFVRLLIEATGFEVVEPVQATCDLSPPAEQHCQIGAAFGDLSRGLESAIAAAGDAGRTLSGDEARAVLPSVEKLRVEVSEFRQTLIRAANQNRGKA